MLVTCDRCGKSFQRRPSHLAQRNYCSMSCRRGLNDIEIDGEIARIIITDAHDAPVAEALIDAADVAKVRDFDHRWFVSWHETTGQYMAMANVKGEHGRWTRVYLHRFLAEAPAGVDVDHINHNMLDNRHENLRLCTRSQNLQNRRGAMRTSTTGIRNVYWDKSRGKWAVSFRLHRKNIYIGRFDNVEDAKQAAADARRRLMTHSTD